MSRIMDDESGRVQKGAFELHFKTLPYNLSNLIDPWSHTHTL